MEMVVKHPVQNGLFHFAINNTSIVHYDNPGTGEFMINLISSLVTVQ